MSEEADTIQHLLDVEHEASEVMLKAQVEADGKIAQARALAEKQFKEKYAEFAAGIDSTENLAKEKVKSQHDKELAGYKESLGSNSKDTEAFNSLLNKLLYA